MSKIMSRDLAWANAVQEMLAHLADDWRTAEITPEQEEAMADSFARLAVCRMAHDVAMRHVYAMLKAAGGPGDAKGIMMTLRAAQEAIDKDESGEADHLDTRH
jgi:hypothetical protein